jgi:hypothetical protein
MKKAGGLADPAGHEPHKEIRMTQISLAYNGQSVEIRSGRHLSATSAESPALPMAESITQQHPHLASRAYKAAMLVDLGHVALRPAPWNIYDEEQSITGRVLSQTGNGEVYTVRLVPGRDLYLYDEHSVEICECPDFGRTKRGGIPTCKHVEAVAMARRLFHQGGDD